MCGPSSAMKSINNGIQQFASTVKSEAGDVFSGASQVFHDIMNSVTGIVNGGPSQYGFSAGEQSAKTAAAVNAGAAEARNLRAAAGASVGAIGGGNVVAPAGLQQEAVMSANQKAAADTAAAENAITQEGYDVGRKNYEFATEAEMKAPSAFDASTAANKGVTAAQQEAATSQQNIDTQSNWAMNDIMKLGTTAVAGLTSGGFSLPSFGGGGGNAPALNGSSSSGGPGGGGV